MSRLEYLIGNPKRSLAALGTLLLAAGLTAGSGAFFTDTDTSVSNSATAATFDIEMIGSTDPTFDAYTCTTACSVTTLEDPDATTDTNANNTSFSISKLVPSDTRTYVRRFGIKNNSNVDAAYRLKSTGVTGATDLPAAIQADVARVDADDAATVMTDGNVTSLNTTDEIAPGDTAVYEVTLVLPDTDVNQNDLRGDTFSLTFQAEARDKNAGAPTS